MASLNVHYGQIIKRAWHLTWTNKWLWVYGMVLAAFSSSGAGFNGSRLSNLGKHKMTFPTDAFMGWVSHVSPLTWVLIGLGILVLVLVGLVVATVVRAWASASLIAAINEADAGQPVTLPPTSAIGLSHTKGLIILGVINGLMGFGSLLILISPAIILGILLAMAEKSSQFVLIIPLLVYSLLAVVFFVIFSILLTLVDIYSQRLLVLHHLSPWAAWKQGFSVSKGSLVPGLIMGFINTGLGCAVSFVTGSIFLVLIFILGLPALLPLIGGLAFLPITIVLALLFIVILQLFTLVAGIFIVFKNATWNLLFKQLVT